MPTRKSLRAEATRAAASSAGPQPVSSSRRRAAGWRCIVRYIAESVVGGPAGELIVRGYVTPAGDQLLDAPPAREITTTLERGRGRDGPIGPCREAVEWCAGVSRGSGPGPGAKGSSAPAGALE